MSARRSAWMAGLLGTALLGSCGSGEEANEGGTQPLNQMSPPAGATNASPSPTATSQFTSIAETDCETVEQTSEAGGFWRRRCLGVGGYAVETSEGDLRQNLALIGADGRRHGLELGLLGSGFSELGPTIEWRGPPAQPFRPRTLTMRVNIFEDAEAPDRPTSYLAVARIEGGAPCIVARVAPGPQQSDEARRIADAETLPGCRAP